MFHPPPASPSSVQTAEPAVAWCASEDISWTEAVWESGARLSWHRAAPIILSLFLSLTAAPSPLAHGQALKKAQ